MRQHFTVLLALYVLGLLATAAVGLLPGAVLAQEPTPLVPGQPLQYEQKVNDTISRVAYVVTKASLDNVPTADNDVLTIILTPFSGDADICVTVNRDLPDSIDRIGACDYKSTTARRDLVMIPRGAAWPDKFNVGVYNTMGNCYYKLTAMTKRTLVVLEGGRPQLDEVDANAYRWFQYQLPADKTEFELSVTSLNGDPDMYVTADPTIQYPTAETDRSKVWVAASGGWDLLRIRADDPKVPAGKRTFFIGVHAYSTSEFIIHATPTGDYTTLMEGYQIWGSAPRADYRYFRFRVHESNLKLNFDVYPQTYGSDPDLYVNLNGPDPKPSRTQYDYSSARGYEVDRVVLPANVITDGQWYYAAVYGYNTENVFSVEAYTEHSTLTLRDGAGVNLVAPGPGQQFLFKYEHSDPWTGISFQAMPVSQRVTTQIDMFWSRTVPRPCDRSKAEGAGVTPDGAVGTVIDLAPGPQLSESRYYVCVIPQGVLNFTVSVSTNHSHIVLRSGHRFSGHLPPGGNRYFLYDINDDDVAANSDLSFTVSPSFEGLRSDVDLYASNATQFPSITSHVWRGLRFGADTLMVNNKQLTEQKNTPKRLYLAVNSPFRGPSSLPIYFNLLTLMSSATAQLSDGVPFEGVIKQGQYRFFKFHLSFTQQAVTVQVNGLRPDTDLDFYCDVDNEHPNRDNHRPNWAGTNWGDDSLFIEDIPTREWLYCGVYGFAVPQADGVPFRFTMEQNYRLIIPNREPVFGVSKPNGKPLIFQVTVPSYENFMVISATLRNGKTRMYVSTNATAVPSPTYFDWSSEDWPGNSIAINKAKEGAKWVAGRWSIAIYGDEPSDFYVNAIQGSYWIAPTLTLGVPQVIKVPADGKIRFMTYVRSGDHTAPDRAASDYHLSINMLSGLAGIFAGQNNSDNFHDYKWSSVGNGDRMIRMRRDELVAGRLLYILATGHFQQDALVELTLTDDLSQRVLPYDQPQIHPTATRPEYFALTGPVSRKDADLNVRVLIDNCGSLPAPTAYASNRHHLPNPTNFTVKSEPFGNYGSQLIKAVIPKETPQQEIRRLLYVGVDGQVPGGQPITHNYQITAYVEGQLPKPIVPEGKSAIATVSSPNPKKLRISVPRATRPARFAKNPLIYEVAATEVMSEEMIPFMNLHTSCGATFRGIIIGQTTETNDANADDNVVIEVEVIDGNKLYAINVLVHNGQGVHAVYTPAWIEKGVFKNDLSRTSFFSVLSVGFFLLLLAPLAVVLYFIIGAIVQFARGKRGVEIIPNSYFWRNLPGLVVDGVVFLFTCGGKLKLKRRPAEQYQQFDATSVNTYGGDTVADTESGFGKKGAASASAQQAGGYGAI